MKRVLVPTLIALACGAAHAQVPPGVQLYGIVDAGVQRVTGYSGGTDTKLVSGIMEGSRFGLRGNEDLGGGWRALFVLENRTELNNGTLGSRPPSGLQLPDRFSQASLLGLPGALQPALNQLAPQLATQGLGVNLANAFWDRQAFAGVVTPVGRAWFERGSALPAGLASLASVALAWLVPMGAVSVWQSFHQGILVHAHRTRAITESMLVLLVATGTVLGIGVAWHSVTGIHFAALGLTAGGLAQVAWLAWRSRGVGPPRPVTAAGAHRPQHED